MKTGPSVLADGSDEVHRGVVAKLELMKYK